MAPSGIKSHQLGTLFRQFCKKNPYRAFFYTLYLYIFICQIIAYFFVYPIEEVTKARDLDKIRKFQFLCRINIRKYFFFMYSSMRQRIQKLVNFIVIFYNIILSEKKHDNQTSDFQRKDKILLPGSNHEFGREGMDGSRSFMSEFKTFNPSIRRISVGYLPY